MYFYWDKRGNQNIKCVMTIMIRDGLKMDTYERIWIQMNTNGSIGGACIRVGTEMRRAKPQGTRIE